MGSKVISFVRAFPDGRKLFKVAYVWPCFNCKSVFEVNVSTYRLLESNQIIGVKCPDCLIPPPKDQFVRAA